ncbi:MAG: trehalose-phosphatase [Actinomycetota bacterium]|nr:trehalose-phosphatase [Actinomycetota bacterium]
MPPTDGPAWPSDLKRSGLFLDFDGTLAEIVLAPEAARPVEGASETLAQLARRLACVAVVSGRSATELLDWLGSEIEIWGLHGAERTVNGRVVLSDAAARYTEVMTRVGAEAKAMTSNLAGVLVEDKKAIVALHYRTAPDLANEVDQVAAELARKYSLSLGRGRMVVEVRPPIEFSKAAVVTTRSHELDLEAVAFVGDDVVDIPAFDALDRLANEGKNTLRVAVRSDESPSELLDRSDLILEGPAGVLEWIRKLV